VRDPRHDILFEPVPIGPVTAKNRFYQVPHCNGMGYRDPSAQAAMRRVKAEGGWAVVCTEQVEIHPSSDITPFIELRIWDQRDLPALARIADAIHDGGALAGIELAHNGLNAPNTNSREVPLAPSPLPVATWARDPVQARAMTLADIAALREWNRIAVRRSLQAGYDLVYVYAGHGFSGLQHFLSRRYNTRTDSYGGSLANRSRLLRELLEDTRELCAGKAAVACRITIDEGAEGAAGAGISRAEIEDVIGDLAEHPDLWDFVMGSWEDDSLTSRFGPEGSQEQYVRGLKKLTTRPVVGVGRFTSPDTMARQVREGLLDLIGAARPSIADPFLPSKIEQGRGDDIRECIGCNICVSGDLTMSTIRCTQNPTMGEEWRRGWHPERIAVRGSESTVLVVGAGPAGLEAARSLGHRGYQVTLAEATRVLGGRVATESGLPGLAAWHRVVDYREQQLGNLPTVQVYRESEMTRDDVLEYGFRHVAVATGARWRRDAVARQHTLPIPIDAAATVLTPDDLLAGARPEGHRVLVYDDDHYYLGGVLAELLAGQGHAVELVTPAPLASAWMANTLEIGRVQARLLGAGITVTANRAVDQVLPGSVRSSCVFTGAVREHQADAVLLVTARLPVDGLYQELAAALAAGQAGDLVSVKAIGDALAPSTIAAATYAGHRYAEELDGVPVAAGDPLYRREVTALEPGRWGTPS
jgi:dimethylamine/trimethylamine dehydrogenase